jgi:O-antigen/teichoic acid export membrane protein
VHLNVSLKNRELALRLRSPAGATGSLLRTTGSLGLATVVARICSLGVIAVIARTSGQSAVGIYGLATLTGSFIALVGSAGFPTYITRGYAARVVAPREVDAIHLARLSVLIVGALSVLFASTRIEPWDIALPFTCVATAVLFDQLNETAWAKIRGTSRASTEALVNAFTYLGLLAVICVFWSFDSLNFAAVGVMMFVVAALRSGLAWSSGGIGLVRPTEIRKTVKRHLMPAAPFVASDVLGLAYLRGDTLVLAAFVSTASLGEYVAAASLTSPVVQVAAAMSAGAIATASARQASRASSLELIAFFSRCGLAVAAALCIAAPSVVRLLYGPGHQSIVQLATVLCLFLPLRFLNFSLSSVALAKGWAKQRFYVVLFSAIANIGLNVSLDPWASSMGAAWATVLTEVGVTCAFALLLKRDRLGAGFPPVAAAVIVACGLQFIALADGEHRFINPATGLVLGVACIRYRKSRGRRREFARVSA